MAHLSLFLRGGLESFFCDGCKLSKKFGLNIPFLPLPPPPRLAASVSFRIFLLSLRSAAAEERRGEKKERSQKHPRLKGRKGFTKAQKGSWGKEGEGELL